MPMFNLPASDIAANQRSGAMSALTCAEEWFMQKEYERAILYANMAKRYDSRFELVDDYLQAYHIHLSSMKKRKTMFGCEQMDYYAVLGIDVAAAGDMVVVVDTETINRSYKRAALAVHPDKNPSMAAEGAFKIISEVFKTLSKPEKRKMYDLIAGHFKAAAWNAQCKCPGPSPSPMYYFSRNITPATSKPEEEGSKYASRPKFKKYIRQTSSSSSFDPCSTRYTHKEPKSKPPSSCLGNHNNATSLFKSKTTETEASKETLAAGNYIIMSSSKLSLSKREREEEEGDGTKASKKNGNGSAAAAAMVKSPYGASSLSPLSTSRCNISTTKQYGREVCKTSPDFMEGKWSCIPCPRCRKPCGIKIGSSSTYCPSCDQSFIFPKTIIHGSKQQQQQQQQHSGGGSPSRKVRI